MSFISRNHPQQVGFRGALDDVDNRAVTPGDWEWIDGEYGPFTLDVASSALNTKTPRHYTREDDGLVQSWAGERVWCNPPYSDIAPWVEKAWSQWFGDPRPRAITMLLPANRCEQKWWQSQVEPYRDRSRSPLATRFLPGRMRFDRPGVEIGPKGDRPPFGCVLLTWRGDRS